MTAPEDVYAKLQINSLYFTRVDNAFNTERLTGEKLKRPKIPT